MTTKSGPNLQNLPIPLKSGEGREIVARFIGGQVRISRVGILHGFATLCQVDKLKKFAPKAGDFKVGRVWVHSIRPSHFDGTEVLVNESLEDLRRIVLTIGETLWQERQHSK